MTRTVVSAAAGAPSSNHSDAEKKKQEDSGASDSSRHPQNIQTFHTVPPNNIVVSDRFWSQLLLWDICFAVFINATLPPPPTFPPIVAAELKGRFSAAAAEKLRQQVAVLPR